MKPITLKSDAKTEDAYLIQSTPDLLYICSPLCGAWLTHIKKTDWVHDMKCDVLFSHAFTVKDRFVPTFTEQAWVFRFPLADGDRLYMYHISKFFEVFKQYQNQKFTQRVETCIDAIKGHLPSELLGRLVQFTLVEQFDPTEQIRLLLSPKIQRHLQSKKEVFG